MELLLAIVLSCVGTLIAVVVVAGLMGQEKKIRYQIETMYSVEDDQFVRSMGNLLPPPMYTGNAITTLVNGREIFPAMLDAIGGATRTVCLETFIYWSGKVGRRFVDVMAERARAGVEVHILIDWLGSKAIDRSYIDDLTEAGAHVELYHPLRWYSAWRVNHRTHRKLLIIDGRIGFTGGVGIADAWDGNGDDPMCWRDNHYRIEGPSVAQMQSAFTDNWIKTHSRVLHGEDYFPPIDVAGPCTSQLFSSSPQEGSESVRLMFLMSLACAAKTIKLASAYFVPDDLAVQTLVDAARRGVSIDIIVPGEYIDRAIARRASRARWGALLKAGIRIHEYQPCHYHVKLMIVDDLWTSVGSTNFDNRSFRLNDEANLNVLDRDFAQQQARLFDRDLQNSRQVTLEQWQNRPWRERFIERTAELLRSQL